MSEKDKLIKKLIGIYEEDWNNPDKSRDSLVEELASLHIQGVKGCNDMTVEELKYEIEEQQENA
jgi:hypothetical protein